jgi:GNAT superfamily N-acetyltransferase
LSLRFEVGCDLEEYRKYQKTSGIHDYLKWVGVTDVVYGELGPFEEAHIKRDPSHLIVWRENNEIIGHVIWHEERVDSFRLPGEEEVRIVLERLLGEKKDFVELHKVWLEEEHRGKGYGKKFFEFFEDFAKKRGFDSIVYYTGNPAAIGICRKRGYKEDILSYPKKESWHVFYLSLK